MDRLLSSLHIGKGEATYCCWCILLLQVELSILFFSACQPSGHVKPRVLQARESTKSEKLVSMVMVIIKVVQ